MSNKLNVHIHSFSYKKGGIPKDNTENGGGFVFDCRGILNPGRKEQYKALTGKDIEVRKYLETETKMPQFIFLVKDLVTISIDDYIERNFQNLKVSFGCTGGQHRSVYAAIELEKFIHKNYPEVHVILKHDEQPQLN